LPSPAEGKAILEVFWSIKYIDQTKQHLCGVSKKAILFHKEEFRIRDII